MFVAKKELNRLLESASSQAPVVGLTHGFYRYPARFSPQFARSAIEVFSKPMDTVMDPFMGGGTAAVEALSLGRRFVGSDLNPLSEFLTRTKTTPLSNRDEQTMLNWGTELARVASIQGWKNRDDEWRAYQINTPWWIRRAIDLSLAAMGPLTNSRQRDFARSAILKTAQWALDCKDKIPSSPDFFQAMAANIPDMLAGLRSFRAKLRDAFPDRPLKCHRYARFVQCDAASLAGQHEIPKHWLPPKLILTSPPYFGIHILYHRWQVLGRRETAAPFWIASSKDGMGAAFYTLGSRQRLGMDHYLSRLRACFTAIACLMDKRSTLVQLVAFRDPGEQLEPYLVTLEEAGLEEIGIAEQRGRFWRTVPNRKWYANTCVRTPASKELLLIHKRG